jgi:TRAP transporter 4TM/12TM fusion protein
MAVVPTLLYYFSLFLMVELDARKYGMHQGTFMKVESAWALSKRYWYHFLSLSSIVIFMLMGFSPTVAVFWATVTAFVVSFFRRESAMLPRRFIQAMEAGTTGVINVAATCASAGIIVGVVTLTGLGLKFSSIVIAYAGGSLGLTALYTALIVWVVGLAVPVTASYIICAVIAAPALITLGVPDYAAHMFIFYYALLSEVSPPTALSCFAAAAITGADPYKTTLQAWKYTMPAFVVPFFFVLDPLGTGILLNLPQGATWGQVSWVIALAFIAIAALAVGLQGWIVRRTNKVETLLLVGGGLLLVLPFASIVLGGYTVPMHADYVGILLIAIGVLLHFGRARILAPA